MIELGRMLRHSDRTQMSLPMWHKCSMLTSNLCEYPEVK